MTRRTRFLVDENPLIAAQWHPDLNGNLDKATIGPGSHRQVFWICDGGHTWQAAVHSRVAGSGCPRCAGYVAPGRVSLTEHSAHLVAEWQVWWRCPGGHEYEARISNRSRGTGYPACARAGILPQARYLEELPDLLAQVDPDANAGIDSRRLLTNDKTRLVWRCVQGHRWPASVRHRAIAGSGCPRCAGRKAAPRLKQSHPGLAAEWHTVRNEGLALEKITAGSHRVVWWQCSDCQGEFRAKIYYRVRGTTRCPHCAQRVSHRDLATESPRIAALWHRGLNAGLTPHQVSAGSNTVVWWSCPHGHEPWRAMVALLFLGHHSCPGCRRRTGVSRQEIDLFAELQHALSGGEQQYPLRGVKGNYRLDMVFPVDGDRRMVVEFDGSYRHRDSFERDLRKAVEIEELRPGWTVVRVREAPLQLTRPSDVAVPFLADPFTAASMVLDHLTTLMLWPEATRERARSYTAGGRRRGQRLAEQLAAARRPSQPGTACEPPEHRKLAPLTASQGTLW